MHDMERTAFESLQKGSKSFSLAARFFPEDLMIGASQIYYWCRYSDDLIDEGDGTESTLRELKTETEKVWHEPSAPKAPPFLALQSVSQKFNIPPVYALELLEGMQMDLSHRTYRTIQDLKLYCYRVASTVGLMMCHVMGLFKLGALQQAAYLGMAMQMTNICRDVKEDFERGRIYLPLNWLDMVDLTPENFFLPKHRYALFTVVKKLIFESENLYASGLEGIKYLPLRSALTILIAGKFYRQIGREILKKGVTSLDSRTIVPTRIKLLLIIESVIEILPMIPSRIFKRRQLVSINEVWKPV